LDKYGEIIMYYLTYERTGEELPYKEYYIRTRNDINNDLEKMTDDKKIIHLHNLIEEWEKYINEKTQIKNRKQAEEKIKEKENPDYTNPVNYCSASEVEEYHIIPSQELLNYLRKQLEFYKNYSNKQGETESYIKDTPIYKIWEELCDKHFIGIEFKQLEDIFNKGGNLYFNGKENELAKFYYYTTQNDIFTKKQFQRINLHYYRKGEQIKTDLQKIIKNITKKSEYQSPEITPLISLIEEIRKKKINLKTK
jgi:hypothetical protein